MILEVNDAVARIRMLAQRAGAVRLGGETTASMGARGVDGRNVEQRSRTPMQ